MAEGKERSAALWWYRKHRDLYKEKEEAVYKSVQPQAKEILQLLSQLTDEDQQNKDISEYVENIENLISIDRIYESPKDSTAIQQEISAELLRINQELQMLGEDISGLEMIAEGKLNFNSIGNFNDMRVVSNDFFNQYIKKILSKIPAIKGGAGINNRRIILDESNKLKGELLECKVYGVLKRLIPVDAQVGEGTNTINGYIDIFQSGKLQAIRDGGSKATSIPEDILVTFGNESRQTLQSYLESSKGERATLSIPAYDTIQKQSFGISVKSGASKAKLFAGNLERFLERYDKATREYVNVVKGNYRDYGKHKDDAVGLSVNIYLVARKLNLALGENNLFFSDRRRMLTPMSTIIDNYINDKSTLLRMYYDSGDSISGQILKM